MGVGGDEPQGTAAQDGSGNRPPSIIRFIIHWAVPGRGQAAGEGQRCSLELAVRYQWGDP